MSDTPNNPGPGPFRRPAVAANPKDAKDVTGANEAANAAPRPSGRRAAPDPDLYRTEEPELPFGEETGGALAISGAAAKADVRRRPWLLRLFLFGLGLGFTAFVAWLAERTVTAASAGSTVGLLTAAALAMLGLVLAGVILGELVSLLRLRGRGKTRALVEKAVASRDPAEAEAALAALLAVHRDRPALAWALARYREESADVPDAADKLVLYERLVMGPLDEACVAEIRTVARRAAILTAFAPNPILDALFVLWLNLSVVRRVARAQGLRPGMVASGALLRRTILAMVAAGGMEALGDMAPAAVAGGVVRTVARRVGEGAINGLLTIRIGVAALEACRPMPFDARDRPSSTTLARQVLGG